MYKKLMLIIVGIMVFLSGCGKYERYDIPEENITKLIINYYSDSDRKLNNKVELDLIDEGACIKYSNYYDETEKQYKIYDVDAIKNFILKNIFDYEPQNNRSVNDKSDEKKILWSIRVTTNLDRYGFSAFDEYPDYWDELWKIIVSASDAEDISGFRLEE